MSIIDLFIGWGGANVLRGHMSWNQVRAIFGGLEF